MSFIRMKKITACILLFIYANGLFAQVSPIMADVLAHTFWRAQHMATVHCENGKYHVHYELYKAADKSGDKKATSNKSDETVSIHIQPVGKPLQFSFQKEPVHTRIGFWLQNPFIKISGPPPRLT